MKYFKFLLFVVLIFLISFLSYKKSEMDNYKKISELIKEMDDLKLENSEMTIIIDNLNREIKKLEENIKKLKELEETNKRNMQINNETEGSGNDKKNNKNEKTVYLTFDDGPTQNTLKILEILRKNNIKATFFVLGYNSNLYSKIVEEGHVIALHSLTHKYSEIYSSVDSYFDDLYRLENLIFEKVGVNSKVVRLPGGSSTTKISKELKNKILGRLNKEGYVYFDWNCDSLDASGNNVSVNTIVENSTKCNQKYVNLLMHDSENKVTTVDALQAIIDNYKDRGYVFDVLTTDSPKVQHYKLK